MNFIYLPLTVLIYLLAVKLQQRINLTVLNPVLITLCVLVTLLLVTATPYADYQAYSSWLTKLLEPAIVALGIPMYQQMRSIRQALPKILLTVTAAAFLAITTTVGLCLMIKAGDLIAASLAPKSVTTPIAVIISESVEGMPALSAMAVMVTGLVGAIFGEPWLTWLKVTTPTARGMAMGIASHALGTAQIAKHNHQSGAYSALALVLSAVISALLCPLLVPLLL